MGDTDNPPAAGERDPVPEPVAHKVPDLSEGMSLMEDLLVPCFCSDGRPAAWQDFFRFPLIPVVPAFLLFPALVPELLGVIPFGSVAIFAALPALFFAFPEAVQVDKVMQRQDGSFSLQDAAKEGDLSRDVIHIRVISKGNLSHVPEVPVQC